MVTDLFIIDIGRSAMTLMLYMCGPMLISALVVGLLIALFQAATHINEMTMTFIPKILTVVLVLMFFLPTMLALFRDFFINLMAIIPTLYH
ncbi:MAG: flagellar biosynthesis protein FliQ [Fibromonadaceae bacterium]|jgi:flagellar biosynthetic protein FliQ|nr:flagellar biosynthesis protein FliQ [Fibromonadaceae bacterium]